MSQAKKCPLIGKKCIEHQCAFYVHLVGLNPQTGQPADEWNCAVAWLPMLLVENANETRKCAASVDKTANEVKKVRDTPVVFQIPPTEPRAQIGVDTNGQPHAEPS